MVYFCGNRLFQFSHRKSASFGDKAFDHNFQNFLKLISLDTFYTETKAHIEHLRCNTTIK